MLTLYWLALILGGGLALFSIIGDFTGTDVDHGGFDHDHDAGDFGWRLFSIRSATYFLFAFGATGVLVHVTSGGSQPVVAAVASLFTGVVGAVTSAAVFRYLRGTSSGSMESDVTFEGLQARVVLPLRAGRGKIMVTRGGREIELMANVYDADAVQPETWKDVVIVEVRGGTALVAPMHHLERADALLPPEAE